MRALAQSVNNFLQNGEDILLRKHTSTSPLMKSLCNSFNDAALALQALPLLHLAGYSSPRDKLSIGQSPIALPALLSEIFTTMCAANQHTLSSTHTVQATPTRGDLKLLWENRNITIGVVSGSFDGFAGRLFLGLLQSLTSRVGVRFIAICFPTPRDDKTDLASQLFDGNINLPLDNKTEAVSTLYQPLVLLFNLYTVYTVYQLVLFIYSIYVLYELLLFV
jgi:hypothetical protein